MSSQKVGGFVFFFFFGFTNRQPNWVMGNGKFPAKGNIESHIWDQDSRAVKEVAEEGDC